MARAGASRLREGWAVQLRVVHALIIRELITRFGRENIGFLWIMAEPLLFAGLVGMLWYFTKGPQEHGISVVAFVATGYIPLTLFRHGVSRSVAVFTANQSLLYHRQIKIMDFILARFIIEILGSMMAYLPPCSQHPLPPLPTRRPAGCTFHSALSSSRVYLKTFHVFLGRDPELSIF